MVAKDEEAEEADMALLGIQSKIYGFSLGFGVEGLGFRVGI